MTEDLKLKQTTESLRQQLQESSTAEEELKTVSGRWIYLSDTSEVQESTFKVNMKSKVN